MRFLLHTLLLFALTATATADAPEKTASAEAPAPVLVMTVQGPIGPAIADFVDRGLATARKEGAQLAVIRMDTPGGLDTSMRKIIKDILASEVPVATFVAPGGARAASAGTYILYASHVAAMAPGTNLGAATPVSIGGAPEPPKAPPPAGEGKKDGKKDKSAGGKDEGKTGDKPAGEDAEGAAPPSSADSMRRKQIHDAAAYIRGLAQMRGRNVEWAEKAVREAVSLSSREALDLKVVDLVAKDVPDLLRQLDGRTYTAAGQQRTLATAGAPTVEYQPDWRVKLLAVITDPSVAYILMLIGIYGLFFEFSNPGFVLPGVVGAICLVLALFAFQLLPVNYAGLALIMLGIAFMVGEAFLPSFGALGIGGVIAFAIGSVMLIDTEVPGFGLPWELIGAVAVISALFMVFVVGMAMKARIRPVVSGTEEMVGTVGELLEDMSDGQAMARVHSELWHVRGPAGLKAGEKVRVVRMQGLELEVVPANPQT